MEETVKTGLPKEIKEVSKGIWELPASYKNGMQVPARIVATEKLLKDMDAGVFNQVTNVACLPGIVKAAYCMPDGHWGYGFPIGGVAAFDKEEGVISPGGIGFDVNCGMKAVATKLTYKEVKPKIKQLVDTLFEMVPSGVGCKGFVKLNRQEFNNVIENGIKWCIDNGYAREEDLRKHEAKGCIEWADSSKVSDQAVKRGINQLGTLGSGNHYLEIQVAKKKNIHDGNIAKVFGINEDEQIMVMVHCGSRGFGHQVATDYLKSFDKVMRDSKIKINDRELSCAPFNSKEGQDYYKAMACAANMAFANRQVILSQIRKAFVKVFKMKEEDLGLDLIWDCCHNIARIEKYKIDNKIKEVITHRKGATKSFGPDHDELPAEYKKYGSPIIIGGSMETGSYLLVGTKKAEEETFSSTAHGSGRAMSRTQARREVRGDKLQKEMEERGIYVKTGSYSGLAEEAGVAYKELSEVIKATELAGISKPIVKLIPCGNVKG